MTDLLNMNQVPRAQVDAVKKVLSQKLGGLIRTGNYAELQLNLQRYCNQLFFPDKYLNDPFVNAVYQNRLPMETYGDWVAVSSSRAYYEDYIDEEKGTKTVTDACGNPHEVSTYKCNEQYESQAPEIITCDIPVANRRRLPITINEKELRSAVCTPEVFDNLVNLIRQKFESATRKEVRDTILCMLNDPSNYKQIVQIPYKCDNCDGTSFIGEIENFALNLQEDSIPYNLAGHDYDIPTSEMWLIQSYKLRSRTNNIMAVSAGNTSLIDLKSIFGNVWTVNLKNFDGVIIDREAIQVHEVFQKITWMYDAFKDYTCGVAQHQLRKALICFKVAVPFQLVKIGAEDWDQAFAIRDDVEMSTNEFNVANQGEAETQIKAYIDGLKPEGSTLQLEYTFSNFKAPTSGAKGSIDVSVDIKNKNGVKITSVNNTFALTLKVQIATDKKDVDLTTPAK